MCFKIKALILTQRHSFIQLELAGNLKTLFDFETLLVRTSSFTAGTKHRSQVTGHRSLFWVVSVLAKQ